jgi:hypothetical protein
MPRSLHLSQHVECPAQVAYDFARDPARLHLWAAGLGGAFVELDGEWRMSTPEGDVLLRFAPRNELGVLDHTVVLPDGTSVDNPMRVLADGDGCEVVFTLRRRPAMSDEDVERDAAAVTQDLATLKRLLEAGSAEQ